MTIRSVSRSIVVLAGTTALAVGVMAAPASARPLERETFHDVFSLSSTEDPFWQCTALGFPVQIEGDVRGSFLLNTHGDSLPLGKESVHGTVSFSANGHTYHNEFAGSSRDFEVVDNGDGTLSVLVQGAGSDKWFLDGELVFHDPGMIRFELLIDHNGTPSDPSDDEFLSFVREIRPSTGKNDGPTRTFCQDLAEFLAP